MTSAPRVNCRKHNYTYGHIFLLPSTLIRYLLEVRQIQAREYPLRTVKVRKKKLICRLLYQHFQSTHREFFRIPKQPFED